LQIVLLLRNLNKPKEDKGKNKKSIVALKSGYVVRPDIVQIIPPEG